MCLCLCVRVSISLAAAAVVGSLVGWLVEIYFFSFLFVQKMSTNTIVKTVERVHTCTQTHRQMGNCGAYMCVHQMLRSSQERERLACKSEPTIENENEERNKNSTESINE